MNYKKKLYSILCSNYIYIMVCAFSMSFAFAESTFNFDDASLDNTKFGTSVAGDATVTESGGTLNITMGASAVNAALVYLKDATPISSDLAITHRTKMDGTTNDNSVDNSVILLLHMNETNGSQTFTDSSLTPKTITAKGTAQISTKQAKFGGSSGSFDGNGWLTIPHHRDFDLGKNNFTIDFWVRFSSLPPGIEHQYIWYQAEHPFKYNAILALNSAGTYKWRFVSKDYENSVIYVEQASPGLSTNTWYHIAIVRTGNTFKIFQDGKQCGTDEIDSDAVASINGDVKIGSYPQVYFTRYLLKGYLDEFRFSKGIARWTSNFIPPTKEHSFPAIPLLALYDGVPSVNSRDNMEANRKVEVSYSLEDNGLIVSYRKSDGTFYYWTGSAWSTKKTAITTNVHKAYYLDVSIIQKNSKFRVSVSAWGNTRVLLDTSYISYSELGSFTQLYAFWGEPFTDFAYCTSMKSDFFRHSDLPLKYAFFNGGGNWTYGLGRCITFDNGINFFKDPITYVIGVDEGEVAVKDIYTFLKDDGVLHVVYAARYKLDNSWRIRYKTSVDMGETFTDHGYITEPIPGTEEATGTNFPVIFYDDANNLWRMYSSGFARNDIIHRYGASLTSLTRYGAVITDCAVGSYCKGWGLAPLDIQKTGATIELFVVGAYDFGWQGNRWTSTDWINWTWDENNPTLARDATRSTSLTADAAAGATQLTVADSSMFNVGDPIIVSHIISPYNRGSNRIASIPDSTHINLYYPIHEAYLVAKSSKVYGYNGGSLYWGETDSQRGIATSFNMGTGLIETTSWWNKVGNAYVYDPSKTPPLPLGILDQWSDSSSENLRLMSILH